MFDRLSATKFEEFCHDLLHANGFVNIDWRKGTGLATSPADKGRDIVCEFPRSDPDGGQHFERYFVDCKHYKKGVPPKELANLLAWAEAERPDVAVFAVSNFLSNSAKDYVETYRRNNKPPFKIKYWEKPQLERMLARKMVLKRKYNLTDAPLRSVRQIIKVEDELYERLWYGRSGSVEFMRKRGDPENVIQQVIQAQREMEKKYGKESLMESVRDEWSWGFLSGKVSAIRWVLGDDWDDLDS